MNEGLRLVNEILDTKAVIDSSGKRLPLHSEIKRVEGELLVDLIKKYKCSRGIEIGCAYGISSLYICSALAEAYAPKHTIIDPFQKQWDNIGMLNLQRAGFGFHSLVEEKSEIALPQILLSGETFDFAFIDGWHTFDHVLVDFFYINRMIQTGGIIVFHDVDMPSIKRLLRYLLKYPAYELVASVEGVSYQVSWKRKLFELLFLKPLRALARVFPSRLVHEVFSSRLIEPDVECGLEATMVAIRKKAEDERDWRWFVEF